MADNLRRYPRWVRSQDGAPIPKPIRRYVATGYQAAPGGTNVDLNVGDPVIPVADGSVAIATAGSSIDGFVHSVERYFNGTVNTIGDRVPGATAWGTVEDRKTIILVQPAANQVYEMVCNDATTFTTEATYRAAIFENADFAFAADVTQKKAFPVIAIAGHAASNALGLRIVDIAPRIDIDFTGLNVPLYVTPNLTRQAPYQTTGIA
jgi:hypothetical protein